MLGEKIRTRQSCSVSYIKIKKKVKQLQRTWWGGGEQQRLKEAKKKQNVNDCRMV